MASCPRLDGDTCSWAAVLGRVLPGAPISGARGMGVRAWHHRVLAVARRGRSASGLVLATVPTRAGARPTTARFNEDAVKLLALADSRVETLVRDARRR